MRTTLYINNGFLEKVKNLSEILSISTNELFALLLESVLSDSKLKVKAFQSICYQAEDPNKEWCRFHVTFDDHLYELGLDLRKFFKVSVSFAISYAIIYYLDEIIRKLHLKKVDNYPLNYIFIAKIFNGIQGLIVFWGIPEEKDLKNLLPI